MAKQVDYGAALKKTWEVFIKDPVSFIVGGLVAILVYVFTFGILSCVVVNFISMAMRKARNPETQINVGSIFENIGEKLVPALVAAIVGGIAIMIGFVFLIIPGIILSVLFSLTPLILADEKIGGIDALKKSVGIVKENIGPVIIMLIIGAVINSIGNMIVVGGLITFPFVIVFYSIVYDEITGRAASAPAAAANASDAVRQVEENTKQV